MFSINLLTINPIEVRALKISFQTKSLFILAALPFLTSCAGLAAYGRAVNECNSEVDRVAPAQYEKKYVQSKTSCDTSLSGRQMDCTTTPVYETIVRNQQRRDALHRSCMDRKRLERK